MRRTGFTGTKFGDKTPVTERFAFATGQESRASKYKDVTCFCKAVKKEGVAKNGYILAPCRYVGVVEKEDDSVLFEEKMKKLSGEPKEYFAESEDLEKKIVDNLRKFEI